MKFQLILSASALLLSTVPAVYADDIQDGSSESGTFPHYGGGGSSGFETLLEGNFDVSSSNGVGTGVGAVHPDHLAAFSDMFVATPRGRNNNNVRDTAGFRNGHQVGVRQAQQTWHRLGGNCRRAWPSFPSAINRIIQRLQRARQTPRNQGRIAGLRQQLQQRRRECNGRPGPNPLPRPNQRNPQVCIRFGNEAARRIAWDYCNPGILTNSRDSWRRDCRDVAVNTCRGQVATEVQNQCGLPNTRTLRQLQGKCPGKVDRMIRNSGGSGRGSNGGWNAEEEMMLS